MNIATLFLQYPACSTCQKAKKWLTENNIEFTNRLIVEENPTVEELKAWIPRSQIWSIRWARAFSFSFPLT